MTTAITTHGGPREGAGRKPGKDSFDAVINLRCTKKQKAFYAKKLGPDWLRVMIEKEMKK